MIKTDILLSSSNEELLVPSWDDFMKVNSEKDLMILKPSVKKKVKSFALLPPLLTRILLV